jgi:hypothetical protein
MSKLFLTIFLLISFIFEVANSLECYSCENCEKVAPLREVCKVDEKFCSVSLESLCYFTIYYILFIYFKKNEAKTSSNQIQTTKACVSKCSQSSGVVAGVQLSVFCCQSDLCNSSRSLRISISLFLVSIIKFLCI